MSLPSLSKRLLPVLIPTTKGRQLTFFRVDSPSFLFYPTASNTVYAPCIATHKPSIYRVVASSRNSSTFFLYLSSISTSLLRQSEIHQPATTTRDKRQRRHCPSDQPSFRRIKSPPRGSNHSHYPESAPSAHCRNYEWSRTFLFYAAIASWTMQVQSGFWII